MPLRYSALGVILLSILYAAIRYNIAGDVAWDQFPLYIINKATALSGVVLLGLAGLQSSSQNRHQVGLLATGCLGLHCVISLMLLSPSYFQNLYQTAGSDTLSWNGSLALLCGGIGILGQAVLWRRSIITTKGQGKSLIFGLGRCLLLLAALHISLIGFSSWNQWHTWPAYLPPITLVACLLAIGLALANHYKKQGSTPRGC